MIPTTALGQEIGVSYLALQGFDSRQCTRALKVFRGLKEAHLSILWNTFGKNTECIQRFLEESKDKPHSIEIHLANGTCLRPPRYCGRGEPFYGFNIDALSKAIIKNPSPFLEEYEARIEAIRDLIATHGSVLTKVSVSFGLEDDLTSQAFEVLRENLSETLRAVQFHLVRNPNATSFSTINNSYSLELHDWSASIDSRGACIWSNDGRDVRLHDKYPALTGSVSVSEFEGRARSYLGDGCRVLLWWNSQGVSPDGFILPTRRHFRLTRSDILAVKRLLRRLENGMVN